MANKFADRANFDIPSSLFDEHEWMADELIDGNIGTDCDLIYPPKLTECENCYFDPDTNRSSGIYKAGGPQSFTNFHVCPYCGGEGRTEVPVTENIRLRIYHQQQDWVNIGILVDIPDNFVQVIGYMADLNKLKRADRIQLHSALKDLNDWVYRRHGEAVPHGFNRNRYFIQFLERTGSRV